MAYAQPFRSYVGSSYIMNTYNIELWIHNEDFQTLMAFNEPVICTEFSKNNPLKIVNSILKWNKLWKQHNRN